MGCAELMEREGKGGKEEREKREERTEQAIAIDCQTSTRERAKTAAVLAANPCGMGPFRLGCLDPYHSWIFSYIHDSSLYVCISLPPASICYQNTKLSPSNAIIIIMNVVMNCFLGFTLLD